MAIKKRKHLPRKPPNLDEVRQRAAAIAAKREAANAALRRKLALSDAVPPDVVIRGLRGLSLPGFAPVELAPYRRRLSLSVTSQSAAVKAICALCQCAQNDREAAAMVRACNDTDCTLWPFRLGYDPFSRKK